MNIFFLDYDGVVNTPMWEKVNNKFICRYSNPYKNKVNNFQAVQWISEFCEKYNYKIVVTSTWRLDDNYKECLINGGLREDVEILGCTPMINSIRETEIKQYLDTHKEEIDNYIIVDDEKIEGYRNHFVRILDDNCGFNYKDFKKCEQLHFKQEEKNTK